MDASEVTEVCRLCPAVGASQGLLNVFSEKLSVKNNMKEVILVTTGIEILENDLVSKKICQRCCNITLKMLEFRQDALKQDRTLKERCSQYLGDKGIRLPNTCVTIKKEKRDSMSVAKQLKMEKSVVEQQPSTSKSDPKERLHSSITQLYQTFPHLKLPKTCVDRHMAPVVSLPMGHVEKYFKKRKLDMRHFIYKPRSKIQSQVPSNKVAKKRTSGLTKQKKTVAPLKISKKLFGNHKESSSTTDSYVCTQISNKQIAKRKRSSVSSSDSGMRLKAKIVKETEKSKPPVERTDVAGSSKATTEDSNDIDRPATPLTPVRPEPIMTVEKTTLPVRAETPLAPEFSEESRESLATNISMGTTSSKDSMPEFLESFGLTPTVTTTKSQTLQVCNICGSVHNNAFELKRHSLKHMVCQFCKRRFKSLDAKQDHIDLLCEVKKIMNSPGPSVRLEKVHLNLDIRKKYRDTFSNFEVIPGLQEPAPVEEVIIKALSPPPPVDLDNVIVLSDDDDDDLQSANSDPLSDISTPAPTMPSAAVVYNTVSIVKPDVRIKYNTILNDIALNINDKDLLKDLITLLKPKKSTVEKMLQTDLPASKDIKINNTEGTCEFKNLKEQLLTYKVPISISNGYFHVGYQFKLKPKPAAKLAHWNSLPIVDVKPKPAPPQTVSNNNQSPPSALPLLVPISQQLTAPISIMSAPLMINSTQQGPQLNNQSHIPIPPPPITPVVMPSVTSNSATPLLQNYALSIAPSVPANKPLPIPKTFVNSAINNRLNSQTFNNPGLRPSQHSVNRNYLPSNPMPSTYLRPCRPPTSNASNLTRPVIPINSGGVQTGYNQRTQNYVPLTSNNTSIVMTTQSMPVMQPQPGYIQLTPNSIQLTPNSIPLTSTNISVITTSPMVVMQPPTYPSTTSSSNSVSNAATTEASKFRVKNVWELQ